MKSYVLGVNRVLEVTKDGASFKVLIKDTQSSAEAVFTKSRWSNFKLYIDDIDDEVNKAKGAQSDQRYCQHYGGGWQISVSTGYPCVDLRRFFTTDKREVKPTRHGIALRWKEWQTLKDIINQLQYDFPELEGTFGCYHSDVKEWLNCRECTPFLRE